MCKIAWIYQCRKQYVRVAFTSRDAYSETKKSVWNKVWSLDWLTGLQFIVHRPSVIGRHTLRADEKKKKTFLIQNTDSFESNSNQTQTEVQVSLMG